MSNVTARINVKGKHFEILVDLEEALKVRKSQADVSGALQSQKIYKDLKKGESASIAELEECFGTKELFTIAQKIIMDGEVQKTQEFRDLEREKKVNQIVSLLVKNASDQHGRPYTEDRLRRAIEESNYIFSNKPVEQQMNEVLNKLKEIIPIKLELKKVKLIIPAQFTGQVYGMLNDFKEREEWLANGNLEAVLSIPSGLALDFFDKLNHLTHGAVQSQEVN